MIRVVELCCDLRDACRRNACHLSDLVEGHVAHLTEKVDEQVERLFVMLPIENLAVSETKGLGHVIDDLCGGGPMGSWGRWTEWR